MGGSEPDGWETGVDVGEMVVMVRDVELPRILVCVAVGVSNQAALFDCQLSRFATVMNDTCLPVIVELVPRDRHLV